MQYYSPSSQGVSNDELGSPVAAPDAASSGSQTRRQQRRFGVNSSAVDFAARIFDDGPATPQESDISNIPGHIGDTTRKTLRRKDGPLWSLTTLRPPDAVVMQALFDVYFDRMHWFMSLVHEPSLREAAVSVFSRCAWWRDELGTVLVCLTTSAVGLQCIIQDPSWYGHALLQKACLDPTQLLDSLVKEIKFYLWDLIEDCSIETVQVCSMLSTYNIFHASPALAWHLVGLSVRTAYALSLHCDNDVERDQEDPITTQVRRRNWNHILVADTFAATIYGRPLSLDSAFACVQPLGVLDDTVLGPALSSHPLLAGHPDQDSGPVSLSTFHVIKTRLYDIKRQALNRFRLLRLQNPVSAANLESLVQTVQHIRGLLNAWRAGLPPIFDCDPARRAQILQELKSIPCPIEADKKAQMQLHLQVKTLHLTYDNALISIHRPLLEYRGSAEHLRELPNENPRVVAESLQISVQAALRMSLVPIEDFEKHFVISFMLMNIFTAGVILCIPPTVWPFSAIANEAKTGILRIIRATRSLTKTNRIALHTEQLLTRLLTLSLQHELDNGLQQEPMAAAPDEPSSHNGQRGHLRHDPAADDASNVEGSRARNPDQQVDTRTPVSRLGNVPPGHQQETQPPLPLREDTGVESGTTLLASPQNPIYIATNGAPDECYHPSILEYGGQLIQVDSQLDETFGTFGQSKRCPLPPTHPFYRTDAAVLLLVRWNNSLTIAASVLFNLVPNDVNSTWAWGGTNGF